MKPEYSTHGIYAIKNILNNMCYVGQTKVSFGDRWDCHKALLNANKHHNALLQNDWNQYGKANFQFVILESVGDDTLLDPLEQEHINHFRANGLCYNLHLGGSNGALGYKMSDETKAKIGEKNKINMSGKHHSDETKRKMSQSQSKRYAQRTDEERANWGKMTSQRASGYHWSEEARQRMSDRQKVAPNGSNLTIDIVHKIRTMHEVDQLSVTEISKQLSLKRQTVYNIATYRRWKYA